MKKLFLFAFSVAICGLAFCASMTQPTSSDGGVTAADLATKLSVSNGVATDLTVAGTLQVKALYSNSTCSISGLDAVAFAGTYVYNDSDPTYGDIFVNHSGKVLCSNADVIYSGAYALGNSIYDLMFIGDGTNWVSNADGSAVSIVMTGIPGHFIETPANIVSEQDITTPHYLLPTYTGPNAWLPPEGGGGAIFPCDIGVQFNSPFAYKFNSDYVQGTGWNSFLLALGNTNYCSFLISHSGWGEQLGLPDQPTFSMFNDYGYGIYDPDTQPYIIGLLSKVYLVKYRFLLNPAVIPTNRSDALVGEIYVEGTNETLKVRLN